MLSISSLRKNVKCEKRTGHPKFLVYNEEKKRRYPYGKSDITGITYEPWHIRYVGSPEIAREITDKGITFEEYLAGTNTEDAEADEAA